MVRQAVCDSRYQGYLVDLAKSSKFTIGLIIGQISTNGKDFVVHLAKTPHSDKSSDELKEITNILEVDNRQVAEHALNCLRMIVGGFNILGLFVVSENNLMSDNTALQKIKTVMMDIRSTLDSNGLLYASTDELDKGDRIFLNYISDHKNFLCKTISTDPSKSVSAQPVDWKFATTAPWVSFETCFELDSFFPLPHASNHFDTEKHVMASIDTIAENLKESIMLFDGTTQEGNLTVEKYVKQSGNTDGVVKVSIFGKMPKVADCKAGKLSPPSDLVEFSGIISSRVYGASRNTIGEIEAFLRQDIVRSLTTRMQIYYDALLANDDGGNDDELNQDQDVNGTIPPRRVFYPIGNENILFGDYLFQNETEETTIKQSMDILNVVLSAADVDLKAEGAPQLQQLSAQSSSEISASSSVEDASRRDPVKLLLIVAIVGAVIALIVALVFGSVLK